MDFSALGTSLQDALGTQFPRILGALGMLIVGGLIAVVVRAGASRLLSTLKVDARINESTGHEVNVESWIAAALFWLVILLALIGAFNSLDLPRVSGPFEGLVHDVLGYLPRLIAGALLAMLAWVVATVLRTLPKRVLAASNIDERLSVEVGMQPMAKSVGNVLFWLVLLLFLPAILGVFELGGLLDAVKTMVARALDMIPSIFAAFLTAFVGWLIGKVLASLVTNLLVAAGADKAGTGAGLGKSVRISKVVGTIVMLFVFIPALIAALDALRIEAISRPASDMLGKLVASVPNIVVAALTLTITFYVARFAAQLLARLINGLGLDAMPEKFGLGSVFTGAAQPSRLATTLLVLFALLFATVEAANRLEFNQVRDVVTLFIRFGADVLLGGLILVVGFWLANLASIVIGRASDGRASVFASLARVAILGLVIAMGLRAMGIADDIVNLACGLTLGAVAVAVALSFGLGGREAAGRQMEYSLAKLRKDS